MDKGRGTEIKIDYQAYGSPYDEIAMASLWGEGYSDREMAKTLGHVPRAIIYWRHRRGIPKVEGYR